MSTSLWFLIVGGLLVFMGLTSPMLQRSPFTAAIVYLAVGIVVGPTVLNLFHFNPLQESALLEVLTEVAVLISLFAAGIKMPAPYSFARWRSPILLATASMSLTVAMVAGFSWYFLGLSPGAAILLGAILAPTDSVLACDVKARQPDGHERLRFNLSCEAGMNDGTAFPFVMLGLGLLGLHDLGDYGQSWVLVDVLWATSAGIAIGVGAGVGLARLSWKLRHSPEQHELLDDFLGLGLIGVVYGISLLVHAWGFLAVFFAAVSLHQTEQKLIQPKTGVAKTNRQDALSLPTVSEGSLAFKEHLERLSTVLLILLLGGTLFIDSWSVEAVSLALFLFIVARPLSVFCTLWSTRTPWRTLGMTGWFGVRGIGSLYYLMYAIQHDLPEDISLILIHLTLIVVTLSILLHGISLNPLLRIFKRKNTPGA